MDQAKFNSTIRLPEQRRKILLTAFQVFDHLLLPAGDQSGSGDKKRRPALKNNSQKSHARNQLAWQQTNPLKTPMQITTKLLYIAAFASASLSAGYLLSTVNGGGSIRDGETFFSAIPDEKDQRAETAGDLETSLHLETAATELKPAPVSLVLPSNTKSEQQHASRLLVTADEVIAMDQPATQPPESHRAAEISLDGRAPPGEPRRFESGSEPLTAEKIKENDQPHRRREPTVILSGEKLSMPVANADIISTGSGTPFNLSQHPVPIQPVRTEISQAHDARQSSQPMAVVVARPDPVLPTGSPIPVHIGKEEKQTGNSDVEALLRRGDAFFTQGDVTFARLFYQRAAAVGNSTGALRLASTFDPAFLQRVQLPYISGDLSKALFWYERARELGSRDAEILLTTLERKAN
jgi:hypothetical protein